MTQKILIDLYAAWQRQQRLTLGSADEHYGDTSLTDGQRQWLKDFGRLWDTDCETSEAIGDL